MNADADILTHKIKIISNKYKNYELPTELRSVTVSLKKNLLSPELLTQEMMCLQNAIQVLEAKLDKLK